MSDEKFEKEENLEQENIETTEDVSGDAAAEVTEEAVAEPEITADAVPNIAAEIFENGEEKKAKKSSAVIAAVVAVLVVAAIVVAGVLIVKSSNKYNKLGYINISGRTLDQVAQDANMTVDEFKAEYDLPEDMKGSTTESAAYYMIPAGTMAKMNGIEFSQLKEMLGLTDNAEITEDTPWGEAEGEALLKDYVGEANVDSFKEYYELGDEITADTKWKDIRNIVDQKALDERLAQEAAEAENTAEPTQAPKEAADTEQTAEPETATSAE